MSSLTSDEKRQAKRFDVSLATRQLEIELYWKRSLFFWGFIAAAFVSVAVLEGKSPVLSTLVSGFGLVCSTGWALANRGSKYWQEQWESKIEDCEDAVTGPLFKKRQPRQDKGPWLSGRPYSVSKLAIALSDYVVLVWGAVLARQVWVGWCGVEEGDLHLLVIVVTLLLAVVGVVLLLVFGKSSLEEAMVGLADYIGKQCTVHYTTASGEPISTGGVLKAVDENYVGIERVGTGGEVKELSFLPKHRILQIIMA
jgi:hypothetical protein